jgi:hypothetical protein
VRLEGLGKLKEINLIGTRSRDLATCRIVPQPTTLPRAPAPLSEKDEIRVVLGGISSTHSFVKVSQLIKNGKVGYADSMVMSNVFFFFP